MGKWLLASCSHLKEEICPDLKMSGGIVAVTLPPNR